jgi:hypothetical protein
MTDERQQAIIRALLEERDAAARKGRDDLVAQIDDQLARYGHEGAPPARRATKRTKAQQ